MTDAHGIARDQLKSFIDRIERLEEERKAIGDDVKDIYGEAKGTGFDPKIIKKIIAMRKKSADDIAEEEAMLETYLVALGMRQGELFEDERDAA